MRRKDLVLAFTFQVVITCTGRHLEQPREPGLEFCHGCNLLVALLRKAPRRLVRLRIPFRA